jgi:cytochrome c oxidase subunit 2
VEQIIVWWVTLTLICSLVLIFAYVISVSDAPADYGDIQPRAYRIRTFFFWSLIALGVPLTIFTLSGLPYGVAARTAGKAQLVEVKGTQWQWELSRSEVTAGRPVEFRVTAGDVNHGMGIYDKTLRLVAQVQAMPGFTNRLVYTFAEPGTYQLLCLEYCGLVHHEMIAELKVTQAPTR